MRTVGLMGTLVLLIPFLCFAQSDEENRKHFYEEFGWTIAIPEGFEPVGPDEWAKMQNRGAQAIQNTFGEEITERPDGIFIFRSGRFSYFEANVQSFDEAIDDYRGSFRSVNEVVYETFQDQMPGAKLDSATSVETIGTLEFLKFRVGIEIPGRLTMTWIMYSRLFDRRELSVNIVFVDKVEGKKMLDVWRASRFN